MPAKALSAFERSFNALNNDERHFSSRNDICTPMECVQKMVDSVPRQFWQRRNIRVLDPCAGNGNFHAYIKNYAPLDALVFNEINDKRIANIRRLFGASANITQTDFLEYDEEEKFDLIVANPPYAKFAADGSRVSKNHNLSRAFIEKGLRLLNENGYLLYIVPDNWMSMSDRNKLPDMMSRFQFIHLDIHGAKKYFAGVGSSFTWFLLKKSPNRRPFSVENHYIWTDETTSTITPGAKYVPLYFNETVRGLFEKCIDADNEKHQIGTNCLLHRYTRRDVISSEETPKHPYRLIHTPKQTVWSSEPHRKYQKGWKVFVSLSDKYGTFVDNCGMTQSIAFIPCKTKREAMDIKAELDHPLYRFLNDMTRYGNFNNQRILARFPRLSEVRLNSAEKALIADYKSM